MTQCCSVEISSKKTLMFFSFQKCRR